MEDKAGMLKHRFQKSCQGFGHLLELGEDQYPFTFFIDGGADLPQPYKFTALLFIIAVHPGILVRMIADLLEFGQRRQNHALALDTVSRVQHLGDIVNNLAVTKSKQL